MIYRTASIVGGVITADPGSELMGWDVVMTEMTEHAIGIAHLANEHNHAENNKLTHIVGCLHMDDGTRECLSSVSPPSMSMSDLVGAALYATMVGADLFVGTET